MWLENLHILALSVKGDLYKSLGIWHELSYRGGLLDGFKN
jgi:hypothetical protein